MGRIYNLAVIQGGINISTSPTKVFKSLNLVDYYLKGAIKNYPIQLALTMVLPFPPQVF